MLCSGRREILHFERGGDIESVTAQTDALAQRLLSKIQATGFLVPEAEHLPRGQSSLEKDVCVCNSPFFTKFLDSQSFFQVEYFILVCFHISFYL